MDEKRIVRIARDKSPLRRRSTGRPRKRWSNTMVIEIEKEEVEEGLLKKVIAIELFPAVANILPSGISYLKIMVV